MDILVAGASGLIGSALVEALRARGHGIRVLVRSRERVGDRAYFWDPTGGQLDPASLDGVGAVVHLAGESIADGRWTAAKKARIRVSRVESTRLLAGAISLRHPPPRVLLSASAVGFYGSRGDEELTEETPRGSGFLADVAGEWEAAARPAAERGTRVTFLRFGVVLSSRGGALAKMLPIFRRGGGGKIGNGKQYVSWILLEDAVGAIVHALERDDLGGPINVVAPTPVTNAEFTHALGRILRRPTIVTLPAFAARLLVGEMVDEALLASQRAIPRRLLDSGFTFRHPDLESALRAAIEGA